jgi:hypothetical protein
VVGPDELPPLLPEAAAGPVQRWCGRHGRVNAHGYSGAGAHWMHVPGLATFRFAGPDRVTAIAAPPVDAERLQEGYRRTVLPLVLQAFGVEVLHASAVEAPRGVVAFCAHSETGKSTVAYGLDRRGYPLWADDAVAFQGTAGRVETIPLPFRVRLRPPSQAYFARQGRLAGTEGLRDRPARRPVPLAAVCALERVEEANGAGVHVERLSAGSALPAVLAHAQSFRLPDSTRHRRLVLQYLALVAGVPVFRVRFAADLARLTGVLDRLERTIA